MFKKNHSKEKKRDISKLQDTHYTQWDARDVSLWLDSVGLSRYCDAFFYNEIDGEMLADLDDDDLVSIPITILKHRKKILKHLNALRGVPAELDSSYGSQTSECLSTMNFDMCSVSSSSSATNEKVRIKCSYKSEITTVSFALDETFSGFKKKIKKEFGHTLSAKYKDEDGDMVLIRDDEDIQEALQCAQRMRIKLLLYSTRSKHKKSSKSSLKKGSSTRSNIRQSDTEGEFHVLENFFDAVIVIDRRGKVQIFNASAEDMFGYDRDEVIGQNVSMLMNDEDSKNHNSYLRRYGKRGASTIIGRGRQVSAKNKEGKLFNVWLSVSETNSSYTGILQDIGRSTEASGATMKIEHDVNSTFDILNSYPDPVFVLNIDGYIQFANKSCHDMFQHEPGSLIGKIGSVICPAVKSNGSGEDLLSDFINSQKGKGGDSLLVNNRRDVICYTKKNSIIGKIAEFSMRSVDGANYYLVQFRSQENNSSSSILQVQRDLVSTLMIPAMIIDENCIVLEINSAAIDLFGYGLTEILGKNVDVLIPPGEIRDDHDNMVKNYAKNGKPGEPYRSSIIVQPAGLGAEVAGLSKSGQLIDVRLSVTMSSLESGQKIFTGCFLPLSKSEKNLRKSDVLRNQVTVIDQLMIPAAVITQDSIVRGFNKGAQKMFGYELSEIIGKDVNMLIPPGDIRNMHQKIVGRYANGEKNSADSLVIGKGRKVVARHKNGANIRLTLSVSERKDGTLTIFTGVFT